MPDIKSNETVSHELHLRERKDLTMNGVTEVVSFDDCSVLLKTVCGELSIEGEDLHISALDTSRGAVAVSGNIQSFVYYDRQADGKRSKTGRFFR